MVCVNYNQLNMYACKLGICIIIAQNSSICLTKNIHSSIWRRKGVDNYREGEVIALDVVVRPEVMWGGDMHMDG